MQSANHHSLIEALSVTQRGTSMDTRTVLQYECTCDSVCTRTVHTSLYVYCTV